ncbi:MAG: hypothetical protein ABDI20_03010 [Candidatus Bipolaricaulaceae bacterium]
MTTLIPLAAFALNALATGLALIALGLVLRPGIRRLHPSLQADLALAFFSSPWPRPSWPTRFSPLRPSLPRPGRRAPSRRPPPSLAEGAPVPLPAEGPSRPGAEGAPPRPAKRRRPQALGCGCPPFLPASGP